MHISGWRLRRSMPGHLILFFHSISHAQPTASVWWMLFFTKFLRSIFVFGSSHGFGLNSFFCKTPYDLRPLLCGSGNVRSQCLYTIKSRVAFYLLQWSLYYFIFTTVTKYRKLLGFTVLHLQRSEGLSVQTARLVSSGNLRGHLRLARVFTSCLQPLLSSAGHIIPILSLHRLFLHTRLSMSSPRRPSDGCRTPR